MAMLSYASRIVLLLCAAEALTVQPKEELAAPENPHAEDALSSLLDFHSNEDPHGESIPAEYRDHVLATEQRTINFVKAFVNSFAMILVTEIGDKTFFIAAIMSMRHSPSYVFMGAIAALAVMTVLGAAAGFMLPNLMPRQYTHWVAATLFAYFGCMLAKDAYDMFKKGEGSGASEELEEVEEELNDKKQSCTDGKIVFAAFSMTFLAEWGDRSQIATIALAAAKDPLGVIAGAIIGHMLCTGMACMGGKLLAGQIPERTVVLVGAIGFLVFAVHSALEA